MTFAYEALLAVIMSPIPVIDISPLWTLCDTDGSNTEVDQGLKDKVIQQIHQACRDVGFFYLTGHGVEQSTLDKIFTVMKSFFALPLATKNTINIHNSEFYRGYFETRSERTLNVVDIREGFYFNPDMENNQLPDERELPGFADVIVAYSKQLNQLGLLMMKALAIGLQLPENFFDEKFSKPTFETLALMHYPPHPAETDSWGVGPHTDYGMWTFLLQDDVGGLEVEITDGKWIEAKPIPGTFVVNLGDCLQAWTKGLYRATRHRVRRSINTDRYSVPFFFNPKGDCLIEPIETNATKNLTIITRVKGVDMPFRYADITRSLLQKSHDWSKDSPRPGTK